MSEHKENVPKIRFPGFTDAWEQRRFGLVFDPIPNNSFSRADLNYEEGKIKSIHYGDILIKYGAVTDCGRDVIPFITGAEVSDHESQLLQNGDVLIADAAEDKTVGKSTEIVGITDIPVVSGLHTIACRPKVKMQPNYLGYYMNSPSYHQQLLPLMQGIKVLSLSRTNLAKTFICYPTSAQEQSLIGKVFANLDHLITLHQRKLNNVKNLKAGLLQKMFPKNGEDFPEIRFPGFTDAWEQRKVIDIAPLQRGFDLPVSEMEAGSYPVIMSNGVGAYHSKYKARAPGVVTGRSGTIGNLTFVETDYWPHNTALWVTDFKGNDAKFIYYLYQKLDLKRYGTGSGVPTLNRNNVHDTKTSIPSVTEQNQISRLFESLDHLITLHQRKLEHLQEQKKGLLQQMFI
ncbi:type I restriction enzyme S subunit [Paenibacillus peoriae]|uniref:Type I restriction enzyme S subunit n=1 Tax=Paenibacillus peoriae TaxID=59893 RepID=A0ABU1QNE5_9BACL|nr:restriction endonuclease subunit S [Paenibacillus peoriae]MDR6780679.1 type I restriction enzyme S subunit [Paenibacillus peoriae]